MVGVGVVGVGMVGVVGMVEVGGVVGAGMGGLGWLVVANALRCRLHLSVSTLRSIRGGKPLEKRGGPK